MYFGYHFDVIWGSFWCHFPEFWRAGSISKTCVLRRQNTLFSVWGWLNSASLSHIFRRALSNRIFLHFLGTWWGPRIDYMSQLAPFGSPWIHFGATYDDWSSPVCQNGRSGWNLDVAEWLRRSKSVFYCRPRAYQMVHFGKLWIHFAVRIFVLLSTRRRMEFCVFFWYQHLEFGTFLRTKTCDCKEPS